MLWMTWNIGVDTYQTNHNYSLHFSCAPKCHPCQGAAPATSCCPFGWELPLHLTNEVPTSLSVTCHPQSSATPWARVAPDIFARQHSWHGRFGESGTHTTGVVAMWASIYDVIIKLNLTWYLLTSSPQRDTWMNFVDSRVRYLMCWFQIYLILVNSHKNDDLKKSVALFLYFFTFRSFEFFPIRNPIRPEISSKIYPNPNQFAIIRGDSRIIQSMKGSIVESGRARRRWRSRARLAPTPRPNLPLLPCERLCDWY